MLPVYTPVGCKNIRGMENLRVSSSGGSDTCRNEGFWDFFNCCIQVFAKVIPQFIAHLGASKLVPDDTKCDELGVSAASISQTLPALAMITKNVRNNTVKPFSAGKNRNTICMHVSRMFPMGIDFNEEEHQSAPDFFTAILEFTRAYDVLPENEVAPFAIKTKFEAKRCEQSPCEYEKCWDAVDENFLTLKCPDSHNKSLQDMIREGEMSSFDGFKCGSCLAQNSDLERRHMLQDVGDILIIRLKRDTPTENTAAYSAHRVAVPSKLMVPLVGGDCELEWVSGVQYDQTVGQWSALIQEQGSVFKIADEHIEKIQDPADRQSGMDPGSWQIVVFRRARLSSNGLSSRKNTKDYLIRNPQPRKSRSRRGKAFYEHTPHSEKLTAAGLYQDSPDWEAIFERFDVQLKNADDQQISSALLRRRVHARSQGSSMDNIDLSNKSRSQGISILKTELRDSMLTIKALNERLNNVLGRWFFAIGALQCRDSEEYQHTTQFLPTGVSFSSDLRKDLWSISSKMEQKLHQKAIQGEAPSTDGRQMGNHDGNRARKRPSLDFSLKFSAAMVPGQVYCNQEPIEIVPTHTAKECVLFVREVYFLFIDGRTHKLGQDRFTTMYKNVRKAFNSHITTAKNASKRTSNGVFEGRASVPLDNAPTVNAPPPAEWQNQCTFSELSVQGHIWWKLAPSVSELASNFPKNMVGDRSAIADWFAYMVYLLSSKFNVHPSIRNHFRAEALANNFLITWQSLHDATKVYLNENLFGLFGPTMPKGVQLSLVDWRMLKDAARPSATPSNPTNYGRADLPSTANVRTLPSPHAHAPRHPDAVKTGKEAVPKAVSSTSNP